MTNTEFFYKPLQLHKPVSSVATLCQLDQKTKPEGQWPYIAHLSTEFMLKKLLSCHKNKTTCTTAIKHTIYVEDNICAKKIQPYPPLWLLRRRFLAKMKIWPFGCKGN